MESLSETKWDVLIAGTGIEQSLLALALSRSDKKILHVDKNDYYGGSTAAFSLQEAESWVQQVNQDEAESSDFHDAKIAQPPASESSEQPKLGFSRAYSLPLAPQLLYTRSAILPVLVSSKVYKQLEFLAVGSWWVYSNAEASPEEGSEATRAGRLTKVPNGREDIFADETIDMKAKRTLMKFLRFVADYENQEVWETFKSRSFPELLTEQFKIPQNLHAPLLALTLSLDEPQNIMTELAVPRIAHHLRSIGLFGPGFACVIPKWGGLAEISQVACRAQAVGGGIYVLGQGITSLDTAKDKSSEDPSSEQLQSARLSARLKDGEEVSSAWVVGSKEDLPCEVQEATSEVSCSRSISIVSSSLESLFPALAEGAPAPAGAVVFFPAGSLGVESSSEHSPVYVLVHSSDTGECPAGQTVLHAFTSASGSLGSQLLDAAVQALLYSTGEKPLPLCLWSMKFEQRGRPNPLDGSASADAASTPYANVLAFRKTGNVDLKFDDGVMERVKGIWEKILGDDADAERDGFMKFEERETMGDDEDEE
ncbi:GDP dissociation inhibitor-domain-containing protein [Phyllosticta capitalensis]|uniref:GDP dissociation inhibitor-domain-containing protein n=1 Tax=Phyllosticta capitalensis TaxID=121624 RepID=UPI00312FEF0C